MRLILGALVLLTFSAQRVRADNSSSLYQACIDQFKTNCTNTYNRPDQHVTASPSDTDASSKNVLARNLVCNCTDTLHGIQYVCQQGGCHEFLSFNVPTPPDEPSDRPANQCASYLNIDQRAVGESIPIVGSDYALNYSSDRVLGRIKDYTIHVPLMGSSVDTTVAQITVRATFAGQSVTQTFVSFTPNMSYDFSWNGLDASSQLAAGSTNAQVTITHTYTDGTVEAYPLSHAYPFGSFKAITYGMGGWTLSPHHFYDQLTSRLYQGDGSVRHVNVQPTSANGFMTASEDGSELYTFDQNGRHLSTANALTGATVLTFNYTSHGTLSSVVDAYGNTTLVLRDASGHMTGIQAPHGQLSSVTLDSDGNLQTLTNPASEVFTMTYASPGGLIQTFQKPRGQVSTFTYDAQGMLLSDTSSAGNSWNLAETDAVNSRQLTATSAQGLTTSYSFDTSTPGITVRTTRTPDGVSLSSLNVPYSTASEADTNSGRSVGLQADVRLGTMLSVPASSYFSDAGQTVATLLSQNVTYADPTHPNLFNVAAFTNTFATNSKPTVSTFSSSNLATTTTSPVGRQTISTINAYGKLTSTQAGGYAVTSIGYDGAGRISTVTQGARSTSFGYNTSGYLSAVTNPAAQSTSYAYDLSGRVISQTLADQRVITYTYDANGNLTSITPPSSFAHNFAFNTFDLSSIYTPPSLGASATTTQYAYNNDKRLTSLTRPSGQTVNFNYHPTRGVLTSVAVASGSYTYSYLNRLVASVTTPDFISTNLSYRGDFDAGSQTYNSLGQLIGLVKRTYNSDMLLSAQTVTDGGSSSSAANFTYDNDNLLTGAGVETINRSASTGQITATSVDTITDSYTYDPTYGETSSYVASYAPSGSAATPLFSETYTRDSLGRLVAKTEIIGGVTRVYGYTYDSSGRLTAVTREGSPYSHYVYDSNSNRVSGTQAGIVFTSTYNAQDEMLTYLNSSDSKNYSYDANGERSAIHMPYYNGLSSYSYDDLGNLKTVQLTSGAIVTYQTDGLGRRISRAINGVIDAYWVYDENKLVAELDGTQTMTKRFVYGTKANVPDYAEIGGVRYRLVTDSIGSVRLVVNTADGTIAQQINYDEFGKVISDSNLGFQPFGYAGGLYNWESGIVHFGARDYDPETGRWLTKDPILFSGGDTNLYGYVMNDPINFIDPLGLWSVSVGGYAGLGGGITFGRNPGGSPFVTLNGGLGIGGGLSYDPNGTSPGWGPDQPNADGPQITTGTKCEASAGAAFANASASKQSGNQFWPQPATPYNSSSHSFGLGSAFKFNFGASATIEIGFH